ncbi:hypothetical protein SVIOM342S_07114 [Streptomyces violaceorubidus]
MRDKSEHATTVASPVTVAVGLPGDPPVLLCAQLVYDVADPMPYGSPWARARLGSRSTGSSPVPCWRRACADRPVSGTCW